MSGSEPMLLEDEGSTNDTEPATILEREQHLRSKAVYYVFSISFDLQELC